MNITRRKNRFVAMLAFGLMVVASACGGGEVSGGDSGRARNIAGGTEVAIGSASYQVALFSRRLDAAGRQSDFGQGCGGTIISSRWVLTADHCIWRDAKGTMNVEGVSVGNGESNYWNSINARSARFVVRALPARGAGVVWPGLDLLLLEVDRPFDFSDKVRPAALPLGLGETWPSRDTTGLITGWGRTLDGTSNVNLRGVTMRVNSSSTSTYCVDDNPQPYGYYSGLFSAPSHLCLLRPTPEVLAAACSGDSGGPFVVTTSDKPILAGVASKASKAGGEVTSGSGNTCTGYTPNLYVRVAAALDWIIPGQVNGLRSSTSANSVELTWDVPTNLPAAAITDYVVEYRASGAGDWLVLNDGESTAPGATIGGLSDGVAIEIRVAGVNDVNRNDAALRTYATTAAILDMPPTTTATTVSATTTPGSSAGTLPPTTTTEATAIPSITVTDSTTKPTTTAVATAPTVSEPVPVKTAVEDPAFTKPVVKPPAGVEVAVAPKTTESQPASLIAVGLSASALEVARSSGFAVPTGATVGVTVNKTSSKVCRGTGASITFLTKGTCRVTVTLKAKGASVKKKTVKLTVS